MDDRAYEQMLRHMMSALTEKFTRPPTEIKVTLQGVAAAAVNLIDGVDCADFLIIRSPDRFESLAATSPLAVDLDGFQQRFGQGPCLDAASGDSVVRSNDLRGDERWPRFAEAALDVGVHSMLSFQLYTHDDRKAALNLVGLKPHVFDPPAEGLAAMLATHAATALIAESKKIQFESALASRDVIGQAKGMIMERFAVDAVRAFELLTKVSQNTNIPLATIAADLVARGPEGYSAGR
jgi:hypothetical protein